MHKFLRIRHRYVFNSNNTLRARYPVLGLTLCLALFLCLKAEIKINAEPKLTYDLASLQNTGDTNTNEKGVDPVLMSGVSDGIRKASKALKKVPAVQTPPRLPLFETVTVDAGETVAGTLQKNGVSGEDAHYAVKALEKHFDLRKVQAGQTIDLHYVRADDGQARVFSSLTMPLSPIKNVNVQRSENQSFIAAVETEELVKRTYAKAFRVKSSVYGAAERAGIPPRVVGNMIRAYAWTLDFQRDIRPGDVIQVMYEAEENEDGTYSRSDNILYATINTRGREIPIYRYTDNDGFADYYDPDGQTLKRMLMKTPIDGARMSSGFGMRRHPILGYNKMHKGVDFAAPTGTPVYAAGNGTVDYAGRKGGYGNYVRIRHNGTLKTAYAHLHKIKAKKGARVKQGDIIGYVGSTGRSTGPHLHYEVLKNDKQVNPRSLNLPTGQQLEGKDLQKFKRLVRSLDQKYAALSKGVKLAGYVSSDNDHMN